MFSTIIPVSYIPPLTLPLQTSNVIGRISEVLGRRDAVGGAMSPRLRRENRIRSIHVPLAIENDAISIVQVTGMLHGQASATHFASQWTPH